MCMCAVAILAEKPELTHGSEACVDSFSACVGSVFLPILRHCRAFFLDLFTVIFDLLRDWLCGGVSPEGVGINLRNDTWPKDVQDSQSVDSPILNEDLLHGLRTSRTRRTWIR